MDHFWQKITSYDIKFLLITRNFFLWQEIFPYDKKFLPLTSNFFLWKEIFFLYQEISSYDKKFLPMTRNFFLGQELSPFDKKFLPSSIHWFHENVHDNLQGVFKKRTECTLRRSQGHFPTAQCVGYWTRTQRRPIEAHFENFEKFEKF